MRGSEAATGSLFSYVDLEKRVPADHPLRVIREIVNATLAAISAEFDALYSPVGRESIPPERLSRALLLQAFYTTRSERQLVERLNFDLLFRWWLVLASRVLSWVMPREGPRESRAGLCRAGVRCARTGRSRDRVAASPARGHGAAAARSVAGTRNLRWC
jgi:hypothetical protein